jgi:misacylated tRNA(Ala) deacylase
MTEELFREDAYMKTCDAQVLQVMEEGVVLNRTVFYPEGGGQPGDIGELIKLDGSRVPILNTIKTPNGILHIINSQLNEGFLEEKIQIIIDWERRLKHMKMHTALHVLCSQVEGAVTGGSVGAQKSRLDFDMPGEKPDKEELEEKMMDIINSDYPLSFSWISECELEMKPELVRTMSVKPPIGSGKIRMIRIGENIDFQPCGGTHVKSTGEIGVIKIGKIENKGRQNRRINLTIEGE